METRESVNELVDHTVASIAGGRLECPSDIVMLRASELARAIKCRDVSCCEVMQAYLKRPAEPDCACPEIGRRAG